MNGDGFEIGSVFVTDYHDHKSYWLVMDYNTQTHHILYVRTMPDVDTGTVDVSIHRQEGGSKVNISYRLTALSPAGNENLKTLSERVITHPLPNQ